MTTEIKDATFLWVSCIFVLLGNLAVMIVIYLYQIPILKKLYQSITISIFLAEMAHLLSNSLYFSDSKLIFTGDALFALMFIVWIVLDVFLFKSNSGENDNGVNENNENDENSPNDKKVDLKNFDFSTAIFCVLMWITYMMHGMVYFNYVKGSNEGNLQTFFFYFLRYPTLQFVFGLFILNQNVSKVFYFIYMIPQAVLWPIASIIPYYVNQNDFSRMLECFSCFNALHI